MIILAPGIIILPVALLAHAWWVALGAFAWIAMCLLIAMNSDG